MISKKIKTAVKHMAKTQLEEGVEESIAAANQVFAALDALSPSTISMITAGCEEDATLILPPEDTPADQLPTEGEVEAISGVPVSESILQETRGIAPGMKQYILDGGKEDPEEFNEVFGNYNVQAEPDYFLTPKGRREFSKMWNEVSTKLGAQGAAPAAGGLAAELPKVDPANMSQGLKDLIAACEEAGAVVETAATTVEEKYRKIETKMKRVATGRSATNYYILAGDAGIGKSYTTNEVLKKTGMDTKAFYARGDIGANPTAVVYFLYKNRNRELIVLDDCDTMIMKSAAPAVTNMLKGAMDPDSHQVSVSPTIAARVAKMLDDGEGDLGGAGLPNVDENDNEIDQSFVDDMPDENGGIPQQFTFNARIIFISNLDFDKINDALLSRSDKFCLKLTQEEYLVRLGLVIKGMKFEMDRLGWTQQQVDDAKALVYSTLTNVIEAAKYGAVVAGVKVKLTKSLEFRMVRDLVADWIGRLEDMAEDYPELSQTEIANKCIGPFVKYDLIPRL